MSEKEEEIVDLESAPSGPIAEMLVGLLQAEGIPAYVDGAFLQDEWAISQKALGRVNATIQVPRQHLDHARRILEEAREAGDLLSEEPEE